ncbi:MAG: Hsp70 family protein [Verrucomicrobiota bacterium]
MPASFDEVARALTVSAARQAGLERFTLLEEPQAAFYDFTAHHESRLASALADVRLVLVVDVGGGTSDFTLVQVGASPEGPQLRRIAVGGAFDSRRRQYGCRPGPARWKALALGRPPLGVTQWNPARPNGQRQRNVAER